MCTLTLDQMVADVFSSSTKHSNTSHKLYFLFFCVSWRWKKIILRFLVICVFCFQSPDCRGTRPGPRNPLPREKRESKSYYLQFAGDDLDVMAEMIAEFLDELDVAGYGEKCQTQLCSCFANSQIVVCMVC
jgi:hypothetical protein